MPPSTAQPTTVGASRKGEVCSGAFAHTVTTMRDVEVIDSELRRLVAALRRAARELGWPRPSIDMADALLERRVLTRCA